MKLKRMSYGLLHEFDNYNLTLKKSKLGSMHIFTLYDKQGYYINAWLCRKECLYMQFLQINDTYKLSGNTGNN